MNFCMIGAGVQGSAAAALLAKDNEDEKIVLADSEICLAERAAEKTDCERLVVTQADATKAASIVAAADREVAHLT